MRSRLTSGKLLLLLTSLFIAPPAFVAQGDASGALAQHTQKAAAALRAHDMVTAEHEYRAILAINPQDSQAWTGLGVLLYGTGREGEAVPALQNALRIEPSAPNAELFLGLSEAGIHACDNALPILNQYFAQEPAGNLDRLTGLTLLECDADATDAMPAIQTAERLRQRYPDDEDVLYQSAELYTRLWNRVAGELMAKHPDSYRVHQLAGEVYEAKNDYAQAIREYQLALDRNPRLPEMHYRIGQMYLHEGSEDVDDKAMNEFQQEKLIDPGSAVTDLAIAGIEMHRHDLDKAKPLYEEAARLDPTLIEADVGEARILLEEHNAGAAEQKLLAVVEQHPDDAEAHYVLMLAYRDEKKMSQAAAEMATFNRLQTEKSQNFQDKLNALLNGKSAEVGTPSK
jgi:predicted Zn-dependent protease